MSEAKCDEVRFGYRVHIPQFLQKDAETFILYVERTQGDSEAGVVNNGVFVRAACSMGYVMKQETVKDEDHPEGFEREVMVEPDQVDDMKPYVVQQIAELMSATFAAAFEVPGK